jgi:hypothetical protein
MALNMSSLAVMQSLRMVTPDILATLISSLKNQGKMPANL